MSPNTKSSNSERDNELLKAVTALDPWFYPLRIGNVVIMPGRGSNQSAQTLSDRTVFREQLLVEEVISRYDLKGKSVLEIACNMGYWSSRYVSHGASCVVGVEGRDLFVKQAELFWSENKPLPESQYKFILGNVLDEDIWSQIRKEGPFDVTLCTGILYHLPEYRQLLSWISEVTRDLMVIDSRFSEAPEEASAEPGDLIFNAIEETRVRIIPNLGGVVEHLDSVGWSSERLYPRFLTPKTMSSVDNYDRGARITVLATPKVR